MSRVRSRGTFAAETRTWTAAELGKLQRHENDALIQLAGYKRWQLRAHHVCMQTLRMSHFVEPITPFVRFGQARLIGHIARAGHSHLSHSAFCGHFFPNFDDVGVLELRWLAWPKQGTESPSVWSQVVSSVREIYGGGVPLPEEIVLALTRCRDLWRTVIHEVRIYLIIRDIRTATGTSAEKFTTKVVSEYEQKWVEHFTTEEGWTPCTPLLGCSTAGRGTLNTLYDARTKKFATSPAGAELAAAHKEILDEKNKRCSCACPSCPACNLVGIDDRFALAKPTVSKPERFDCCPRDKYAKQPLAFSCAQGSRVEDHEQECEKFANIRSPWEGATLPPDSTIGNATGAVRERVHKYSQDQGVLGKLCRFVGKEAIDAVFDRAPDSRDHRGGNFQSVLDQEYYKLLCEVIDWTDDREVKNFVPTPPGFSPDFYKPGNEGRDDEGKPLFRLTGLQCRCAECTTNGGSGRTQKNVRDAFVHMRHVKQRQVQAAFREAFPPPPPKHKVCPAEQKELKKAEKAVVARHAKNITIANGIIKAKKPGVAYCRREHVCRVTIRFPVADEKAVVITRTFDPFAFLTPQGALARAQEIQDLVRNEKEEHIARITAARKKKRGTKRVVSEC
eukprot:g17666.t1